MFTLGAAARHLNISKGTLSRAVKDGKLSAQRLDNGSLAIDPSELQRYSDAHANRPSNALEERSATPDGNTIELRARLELAEQRLADLRELVHDLKVERDDWKTVAKRFALTSSQPQPQPAATPPAVVAVTTTAGRSRYGQAKAWRQSIAPQPSGEGGGGRAGCARPGDAPCHERFGEMLTKPKPPPFPKPPRPPSEPPRPQPGL